MKAALKLLLAKETRLLQTLDRLRTSARQENKARSAQQQLGGLAQPKTWTLSNGKKVDTHIHTHYHSCAHINAILPQHHWQEGMQPPERSTGAPAIQLWVSLPRDDTVHGKETAICLVSSDSGWYLLAVNVTVIKIAPTSSHIAGWLPQWRCLTFVSRGATAEILTDTA
jgi:hypothetical protein